MHPRNSRVPSRPRLFNPTIWWIHFIVASKMELIYEAQPGRGGGRGFHVARLNFKTSHACGCLSMLVAYCQLCRHCRNLAEGGCLLSRFHFTRCRYFLGHVACQNLPWQVLIIYCSCIYVVIANLKFSSL